MHDTMKHSSGGPTYLLTERWLKWSRLMTFQVILWFVLFTAHAPLQALSVRDLAYVEDPSILVWNETREKSEGKCLNFHGEKYQTYFFYWPEDNPLFHHCCTSKDASIYRQYKYSRYGPPLAYVKYYDLGFFDQCMPFWKCQNTYSKIYETQLFTTYCETTDLSRLYKNRFWALIVWKYSLLQTILPWIPILEVVVILIAVLALFPLTMRRAGYAAKMQRMSTGLWWENLVRTSKKWLTSIWKRLLMDWTHLYLLAMIGNGLLEATRRQTLYSMQSKAIYDYSMLYLSLFVILSMASLLQQLAYWIECATGDILHRDAQQDVESHPKETDEEQHGGSADIGQQDDHVKCWKGFTGHKEQLHHKLEADHGDALHRQDVLNLNNQTEITIGDQQSNGGAPQDVVSSIQVGHRASKSSSFTKLKEVIRKLTQSKNLFSLSDDYKWQPIAAQGAILFAMGSFLTYAVQGASDMWGIVLGFIVQVGCLWTGLYATVVFLQRAAYIFKFFVKPWDDVDGNSGRTGRTVEHSLRKVHW